MLGSASDLTEFQHRLVRVLVASGFVHGEEVRLRRLNVSEPVLECQVGNARVYIYTDAFQFELGEKVNRFEAEDVPTEEVASKCLSDLLQAAFVT